MFDDEKGGGKNDFNRRAGGKKVRAANVIGRGTGLKGKRTTSITKGKNPDVRKGYDPRKWEKKGAHTFRRERHTPSSTEKGFGTTLRG